MQTLSKLKYSASLRSPIATLLSAALIGVSVTGCSTLSEEIKAAQQKAGTSGLANAGKPTIVVAAVPSTTKLPDIPKDVEACLLAKPKADGTTADAKVTALVLADKTKAKCAAAWFKQYRERQKQAAAEPAPDGHPKTDKKGKAAATWE